MKSKTRSPEAEEYRRWYKTARWQRRRRAQLDAEPLCRMCKASGRITPAKIADHVEPHRGNYEKFWNGELQSLCKAHHDATKQREENRGYVLGPDISGRPIDPDHPWNR